MKEVEVKFRIDDIKALEIRLWKSGFRQVKKRAHETNTLYDLPKNPLRRSGQILRLRRYGESWLLTHKSLTHKSRGGRACHKSRVETETAVANGKKLHEILLSTGFRPTFRYEKYRSAWRDSSGSVVIDETPIGNLGEIEGPPRWIDRTAKLLGVKREDYITKSYAEVFADWKRQNRNAAPDMLFKHTRGVLTRKKK